MHNPPSPDSNAALPTPEAPLQVALPLLSMVRGGMGGTETYGREIIRQLSVRPEVSIHTYVAAAAAGFSSPSVETVVPYISGGSSTTARLRTVAESTLHRGKLQKLMANAEVINPLFTLPLPPATRDQAFVQALHDVQHLDLPHLFPAAERMFRKRYYDKPAREADVVMTLSSFAKEQIVHHLGVDPERVMVSYLGVDADEFTPNLGPREDIIMYPARGWAHKNHTRLFAAMRILKERAPHLKLVLTGGALDDLRDIPDNVEVRGLVPLAELRGLYQRASCLVFPSLYEGFGLPPMEAMASGCPVACSTSGSLPEVVGNAAVLFDPTSPDEIAQAVLDAIEDTERLQTLGLARVREFTWESCTDRHVAAYRLARTNHGS
ncbi:glycosyltransferase family 4 protein [Klugiella xanthotipulae]|nr:glycosyltransferase family 1 protein [Klugiella xanthotipulae]